VADDVRRALIDVPGTPAPGYFVSPSSPRAAVVVVHESFGRTPELEAVCERFADAGYAALLPDLFGDQPRGWCLVKGLREIARGEGPLLSAVRAAADVVAETSGVPRDRVGVIGFCLGGGLALAVGNAFAVTGANYGEVVDVEVLRGIGPTIACYGARDRAYGHKAQALRERLQQLGVPHEVRVYDAGHGFLTEGHHPFANAITRLILDIDPARDASARDDGWRHLMAFFARHLLNEDDDFTASAASTRGVGESPA
jgi:carboxymethylenebutenolidase